MEFGPVPVDSAEGAILAHSVLLAGRKLAKGRLLDRADVDILRAAGLSEVTVARPGLQDVTEDAAAAQLAAALVPDPGSAGLRLTAPHTGRVNLHATRTGVLVYDPKRIHALNRIDPSITFATLIPYARVGPGQLVGTVKIISYAVDRAALAAAAEAAGAALAVRPVTAGSAGLVLTEAPGQAAKLTDKGRRAVAQRLRALGISLADVRVVRHDVDAIAEALRGLSGDLVLVLTGAATSDLHDDAPEAVRAAGGTVARFGMPVDPGNLLFLGRLGRRPVIGLPGCARSPALNGADWVLERLACGIEVTDDDIAGMGVGGLLKESPVRPHPREGAEGRD